MAYVNNNNFKAVRQVYSADEIEEMKRDDARQEARDAALEAEVDAIVNAVHPALRPTAAMLLHRDGSATEAECIAFVLEQVAKVGMKASEANKPELRTIYKDVKARGGEAYAEHKARLIALKGI